MGVYDLVVVLDIGVGDEDDAMEDVVVAAFLAWIVVGSATTLIYLTIKMLFDILIAVHFSRCIILSNC
jgi:hypothetical protein